MCLFLLMWHNEALSAYTQSHSMCSGESGVGMRCELLAAYATVTCDREEEVRRCNSVLVSAMRNSLTLIKGFVRTRTIPALNNVLCF